MDAATLYEFVLGIHVFFAIVTYRTLLSQERIGAILSIITTSCCSCVFKFWRKNSNYQYYKSFSPEKYPPPSEANNIQHGRQRSVNLDVPTKEEPVILNYTYESAQVCQMLWRKPSSLCAVFNEKQLKDERTKAHFEFLHITYKRLRYNWMMIHIS